MIFDLLLPFSLTATFIYLAYNDHSPSAGIVAGVWMSVTIVGWLRR